MTANPTTTDTPAGPQAKDAWVSLDEVPILLGVVAVDSFLVYAVTWWLPWFRWSDAAVSHRETLWSVLGRSTPVIATSVALILLLLDHAIAGSDSARRRGLFLGACTAIALVSAGYGWALANGFDGDNGTRYDSLTAAKVGTIALSVSLAAAWLRCLIRAIAPPKWEPGP